VRSKDSHSRELEEKIRNLEKEVLKYNDKIRNLEVEVTVKERLILEEKGKNRLLQERLVNQEKIHHHATSSVDKNSNDDSVKQTNKKIGNNGLHKK
jgi:hypothetical protein